MKQAPPPAARPTEPCPPIASVSSRTIASPSPAPSRGASTRTLPQVEALKGPRHICGRYPGTTVADRNRPRRHRQRHRLPRRADPDRILEEVGDDLKQTTVISPGERPIAADLHPHAELASPWAEPLRRLVRERRQVDLLGLDLQHPLAQSSKGEQVPDHPLQPL